MAPFTVTLIPFFPAAVLHSSSLARSFSSSLHIGVPLICVLSPSVSRGKCLTTQTSLLFFLNASLIKQSPIAHLISPSPGHQAINPLLLVEFHFIFTLLSIGPLPTACYHFPPRPQLAPSSPLRQLPLGFTRPHFITTMIINDFGSDSSDIIKSWWESARRAAFKEHMRCCCVTSRAFKGTIKRSVWVEIKRKTEI